MEASVEHNVLEDALRRSGANWDVAQAHGLLCGRLSVDGVTAGVAWINEVLDDTGAGTDLRAECEALLDALFDNSYRQLAERRSEFLLLLPDDSEPATLRAEALAHWCEGYLHGLVSGRQDPQLRRRLAAEPLAGLIKDLLQITRASADADDDEETNESAYVELVEYVRVGVQLAYEELAPLRTPLGSVDAAPPDAVH
ncbi:MAG TPA: UPF0149 family protein [Woeseiaceae bacterium]|nr:UPF0149 family protein [Woeseiaceae bacterium]